MKYIISEQQNNKLIRIIQNEINLQLKNLQKMYEDDVTSDYVHDHSLEVSNSIESIQVTDVKFENEEGENFLVIQVILNLNSIFIPPNIDSVFDTIFDEMEPHFGKMHLSIDEINRPNRDW